MGGIANSVQSGGVALELKGIWRVFDHELVVIEGLDLHVDSGGDRDGQLESQAAADAGVFESPGANCALVGQELQIVIRRADDFFQSPRRQPGRPAGCKPVVDVGRCTGRSAHSGVAV